MYAAMEIKDAAGIGWIEEKGMGVSMVKSVCVTPRPLSAILNDWKYQPRRGGKISIPVT